MNVWNLTGFADEAFGLKVVQWNEEDGSKFGYSLIALQEYAPGVVATRDSEREFLVVLDAERWEVDEGVMSDHLVATHGFILIEEKNVVQANTDFDDLFLRIQQFVTPKSLDLKWHTERSAPILASQS